MARTFIFMTVSPLTSNPYSVPFVYMFVFVSHDQPKVYSKSSRGRDDDNSPGVFVSIPADLVAASSKIMVGTRSMQLDVPFAQVRGLHASNKSYLKVS